MAQGLPDSNLEPEEPELPELGQESPGLPETPLHAEEHLEPEPVLQGPLDDPEIPQEGLMASQDQGRSTLKRNPANQGPGQDISERQLEVPGNQMAPEQNAALQGTPLFRDGIQPQPAASSFKQPSKKPQGGATPLTPVGLNARAGQWVGGKVQGLANGLKKGLETDAKKDGGKTTAGQLAQAGQSIAKIGASAEKITALAAAGPAGWIGIAKELFSVGKELLKNKELLTKAAKMQLYALLAFWCILMLILGFVFWSLFNPPSGQPVPAYSALVNPGNLTVPDVFSPEMILSDDMLITNTTFPSAAAIDQYLKVKGSLLADTDISKFGTIPPECAGSKTAGDIIWCATRGSHSLPPGAKDKNGIVKPGSIAVSINPMFIMADMQKEQSLLNKHGIPNEQGALDCAMSYGCHRDSGLMDKANTHLKGFAQQVVYGSMLFQSLYTLTKNGPGEEFKVGGRVTTADGQTFIAQNAATAVMYDYNTYVGMPTKAQPDGYANYALWKNLRDPYFRNAIDAMGLAKVTGQKNVTFTGWSSGSSHKGQDGVSVYKLRDFSQIPYNRNDGSYDNLGWSGSGIMVAASVLNYYGIQVGPPEIAAFAVAHQDHPKEGTSYNLYAQLAQKYGLTESVGQAKASDTKDKILAALKNHQPVITAGMGTGNPPYYYSDDEGHYIVLTGIRANGTIDVVDSKGVVDSTTFDGQSFSIDTILATSRVVIYLSK
jgi:hypothetical protein